MIEKTILSKKNNSLLFLITYVVSIQNIILALVSLSMIKKDNLKKFFHLLDKQNV